MKREIVKIIYIYVYLSLKGDQTFLNVSERGGERKREKEL